MILKTDQLLIIDMRQKLNPINMIVSNKKYVWSMYYEKDKSVFWFIRSFDGSSFTYKIKDGKTSTIVTGKQDP